MAKGVRAPEQPETAEALNNLGFLFQKIDDYAKAEPLFQEALRIRQKVLGSEHPDTALSLNNLGELYQAPNRKAALAAYDLFISSYQTKFPKACECLQKDQEVLFTFYDFPAQHWPQA